MCALVKYAHTRKIKWKNLNPKTIIFKIDMDEKEEISWRTMSRDDQSFFGDDLLPHSKVEQKKYRVLYEGI